MKRFCLTLLIIFIALFSAFAYTDSFKSMNDNPYYLSLLDVIKNGGEYIDAQKHYNEYLSSGADSVDRSRVEYHMVRYYVDKGDKNTAQEHFERQRSAFNTIPSNESEVRRRTAEADLVASEYYITGKMGTGMKNSDLTKALYKDFPDEYYSVLQEAFRLLYTPPIAGGNSKRALRMLNDLEKDLDDISKLDHYSFLVAKAMALSKTDSYDESDKYLDRAVSIYTFDEAIEDIRRANRRGRR